MKNSPVRQLLSERLIAQGLLDRETIKQVFSDQSSSIENYLSNRKFDSESDYFRALATVYNFEYVDLTNFSIPKELFAILPATKSNQLEVVPYKLSNDHLYVVTSNPFNLDLRTTLESITNYQVRLLLSTKSGIAEVLKASESSNKALQDLSKTFKPTIVRETEEGKEKTMSLDASDASMAPVVKLINTIVLAALQRRVTDIHLETYQHGVVVKYRIDGVLYPAIEPLDFNHHSALISRLKVMSDLDIAEKRVPQDGRFKLRFSDRDVDFRVSILPSIYGEDAVIRILDQTAVTQGVEELKLESLNMNSLTLKKFRRAIREPYGMVLITGPTGSGKTTTLYAAMTELNSGEEKMITIEDPVEYQLDGIVQIPVNEKKNLTFARGLRSILRHDPDKIMVGEIRDAETAQIAVQSALTGHLVFTTVHANSAFDVVNRFVHMGIDINSFVNALNCVLAQRLVRRVCQSCKTSAEVSQEEMELSGINEDKFKEIHWVEGKGCDQCDHTGYRGRAVITELLELSPKIRDTIFNKRPISELKDIAVSEGMISLRESALELAIKGQTTLKEINRVTFVD